MTPPNFRGETSGPAVPDPASKPVGRWVRIALAISLALNLGVAGIVAGAFFRDGGPMRGGMIARDIGFGPFTEALSKEDRGALRQAFLTKLPEMRDGRRVMRADFAELLTQLRAVPFDVDGLRQVFDRQNVRNAERLQLGQNLIFDLVVGMTDDARQGFADRLEQSLTKGPNHRDGNQAP